MGVASRREEPPSVTKSVSKKPSTAEEDDWMKNPLPLEFEYIKSVQQDSAASASLSPTRFIWEDPSQIPRRDWLYGWHLMRGILSLTVAPGGVGKSSLMVVQALELASGKELLGHRVSGQRRVWLINLEDDRNELRRRVSAAIKHHGLNPVDIGDRLYVDSGLEQELLLASERRDDLFLNEEVFQRLEEEIRREKIDVVIIDPFVSAHQVNEADNGKIDRIAKRLARLALHTNCALELVHHTRKLNGMDVTSEASRGASSLLAATRSSRTIQKISEKERREWGVVDDRGTYFFIQRDKANLAHAGSRETYRTVSLDLGQGDEIAVVERFEPPDAFDGISVDDLLRVQRAIDGKQCRFSDQADDWVGNTVAKVLGLDARKEQARIKKMIRAWINARALVKTRVKINSRDTPIVEVGELAGE